MTQQRSCQYPTCNRPVVARGWCNPHYIRWSKGKDMDVPVRNRRRRDEVKICAWNDCQRSSRENGMCGMHAQRQRNGWNMAAPPRVSGQRKICQQKGCDRQAVEKGYCRAHHYRFRNGLDMAAPIRNKVVSYNGAICEYDGCDRPARANGWCELHWRRERRGVPMDAPLRKTVRNSGKCQWPGCERKQKRKFMCEVHYNRQRDGRDMDAPVAAPRRYNVGLDRNLQADGYVEVRRPGHFGKQKSRAANWYLEHRYVMECHLGRPLSDDENVHHINGDRSDNRLENLELWTSSHPAGQRVVDLLDWADDIITQYEEELDKLLGTQLPLEIPQDDGFTEMVL